VRSHSVFLRAGCILPEKLNPLLKVVGDNWDLVEEITGPVFDTMIRQAGWHFMWMQGPCLRRGVAFTPEAATLRALARALQGIMIRFNSAELDSVQISQFLGFYIARVTLHSRQIQRQTSLESAVKLPLRPATAI
jgi:hypothetical protein